mgnify:FL=1
MRKHIKWFIPVVCGVALLAFLGGAYALFWNRPRLSLEYDKVSSATIRQATDGDEVILNGDELTKMLTDMKKNRFTKAGSSDKTGGWTYRVTLYGDDSRLYDISVLSDNRVEYDGYFYKTEPGLNLDYLSDLFNR